MKLKELLTQYKVYEFIDKPENEIFVTVSQKGRGVSQRNVGEGKTPVQFSGIRIKAGQFIYARIGAYEGSFGIVPGYLNNAVVSKDFPVFDISDKIIPEFLLLSLLNDKFLAKVEKQSDGEILKRCKEEKFLELEIDVPSTKIQEKIVKRRFDGLE